MFEYLKSTQHASAAPFGGGTLASVLAHGAIVATLLLPQLRHQDPDAPTWNETIEGLTYIAPPNVASAASQVQVRYEASGGGDGEADPTDADDGLGRSVRGSGPGESAVASVSGGEDTPDQFAPANEDPYENAFSSVEVEAAAERDPTSAAPVYPRDLMMRGIEGYAAMRFVVDSTGLVDLTTVRVLDTTHPEFAVAVRQAMPGMRFTPARLGDRPVRQLAEQLFAFKISLPDTVRARAATASAAAARSPLPPQ